jgi:hypothetical protein
LFNISELVPARHAAPQGAFRQEAPAQFELTSGPFAGKFRAGATPLFRWD